MRISMLRVSIEIPSQEKASEVIITDIVKNQPFVNNFKLNKYQDLDFFVSKDDNRLITLGPKNIISIVFNPKNLDDEKIKKVEEEVSSILHSIKNIHEYNHLHQEVHFHLKNIKLKFNPVSLVDEIKIKKELNNNNLKVGMIGVKFSEKKGIDTKVTFYEKGFIGIITRDVESNKLDILNKKNNGLKLIKPIQEK